MAYEINPNNKKQNLKYLINAQKGLVSKLKKRDLNDEKNLKTLICIQMDTAEIMTKRIEQDILQSYQDFKDILVGMNKERYYPEHL